METIALGIYSSFECLAGKCVSTCCAGWQILVDTKDYGRFLQLNPLWLREDILSHIREKDGRYYFQNGEDGRCAMLDGDGLCRIQRNTEEKALCNTCRKYPRLVNQIDGTLYLSMAASCPVVADYLLSDTVFWRRSCGRRANRNNVPEGLGAIDGWEQAAVETLPVLEKEWDIYWKNQEQAEEILKQRGNEALLYGCFEKMADSVLDLVLQYREGNGLLSFLQVLEKDVSGWVEEFVRNTASDWKKLRENYMAYRLLSRKIEFPKESPAACYRRASGELFLLRLAAFCVYADGKGLTKEAWIELLCKIYRFCAHGEKGAEAFGRLTASFFPEDSFWGYMLL